MSFSLSVDSTANENNANFVIVLPKTTLPLVRQSPGAIGVFRLGGGGPTAPNWPPTKTTLTMRVEIKSCGNVQPASNRSD